jgi:two-component sensor histidine kinase
MSDNKLPRDELEALRWFRERLRHVAREHPELTTQEAQERLSAYLTQQALEEQDPCQGNPADDQQDDPQEPDTSTTPSASP